MSERSVFGDMAWRVALQGYAWVDDQSVMHASFRPSDETEVIVPLQDEAPAGSFREAPSRDYSPIAVPALHRRFADVEPTREGIAAFCTEFGLLGRQPSVLIPGIGGTPTKLPDVFKNAMNVRGEGRGYWTYQSSKVRTLMRLHDALRSECCDRILAALVDECPKGELDWLRPGSQDAADSVPAWFSTVSIAEGGYHWEVANPHNIELEMALARKERKAPPLNPATAAEFLRHEINRESDRGARGKLRPGQHGIVLRPRDLLGAIYVQMALEIGGQSLPVVRCPACGNWLEQQHARQRYCEDRCRATAYRRRKAADATSAKLL